MTFYPLQKSKTFFFQDLEGKKPLPPAWIFSCCEIQNKYIFKAGPKQCKVNLAENDWSIDNTDSDWQFRKAKSNYNLQ